MTHSRITLTLGVFIIMAMAFLPGSASAASSRVTCELTVTTPHGEATFDKKEEVLVQKGDEVTIAWESDNATKVVDQDKEELDLEDSLTVSPDEDETYSFRFTDGSKKADCAVSLTVVDASIDEDTLTTDSSKPTISGEAEGIKSVRLVIENEDGKSVFKKTIRAKRGEWDARVTKALKDGTYDVMLLGNSRAEINVIASGTLIVGEGSSNTTSSVSKKGGALSVSALPLLSGGNAANGASVPVAYIKVSNPSDEIAHIDGFTLKQNGSANTNAVFSVSTNDDKSGSRFTTSGAGLFKNGLMYVPLPATVAPGQVRIFTIKTNLASNSSMYAGQNLMLDVVSVTSGAKVSNSFPIKGTTWTLTN